MVMNSNTNLLIINNHLSKYLHVYMQGNGVALSWNDRP